MCAGDQHLQREDLHPHLAVVHAAVRRLNSRHAVLVQHLHVPQVPSLFYSPFGFLEFLLLTFHIAVKISWRSVDVAYTKIFLTVIPGCLGSCAGFSTKKVLNTSTEESSLTVYRPWGSTVMVTVEISIAFRDRFRFVLRHLELTSDPDKPELFRKEKRKQVEHFLRTYLKVCLAFF